MASTPVTMTTADAYLKDFMKGPVESVLNKSHPLLDVIDKGTDPFRGRDVIFPVTLRRPDGVGFRATYLPEAKASASGKCTITAKKMYARIELSGEVMAAAQGDDVGAFQSAARAEIEGAAEATADDLNRACYGFVNSVNNNTGALTQVNMTGATATSIVTDSNRYLAPGMRVWIGTAAEIAGGTADKVTVLTVSDDGVTITIASTAVADNDLIVRGDTLDSNYNCELTGLNFAIRDADDNFQGIDTGDYPEWASVVMDNPSSPGTTRNLDTRLMHLTCDKLKDVSGRKPNFLLMHSSMRREYADLLTPDTRYVAQKLHGGYETINFASSSTPMSIHDDKHATYGTMFFLNTDTIKKYEMKGAGWEERTGAIWRPVTDKDSFEALYVNYLNIGYRQRNALAKLTDLSYSLTA